ncbi:MAG: nucleotidyltransferase family protein [Litoreibacter sp.]
MNASRDVKALVLAGARSSGDPLCDHEGVDTKALIEIGNAPMIAHVIQALKGSNASAPIYVLGGDKGLLEAALHDQDIAHIDATGAGPAASLANALGAGVSTPLLVTTCDHPLLTHEIVEHFVTASRESGADICVGFARRATIEATFPGSRRTYLPFGSRDFSGCNLFYLANERAAGALEAWKTVEAERKRPWRMARRLGLGFLLRMFFAKHSTDRVFALLSRRFGTHVRPVVLPFAEAAVDVDTVDDLTQVRAIIDSRH